MSWSFSFETTPTTYAADAEAALDVACSVRAGDEFAPNPADQIEHGRAAMEVAVQAAGQVLASGHVGTGRFRVRLNGHANPGHTPQPGWANDYVGFTVEQL